MTAPRTVPWLLTVGVIALAGLLLSAIGVAGPLRTVATVLASPLQRAISGVSAPVVDLIGNVASYDDIRAENRDLRTENERLRADLARLREEDVRATEVEELLKLRADRPNDTFAYAAVIARGPNPLRQMVEINRGSGDGIREGMPVLGRGGALVGTVERVQQASAWVRLITDGESSVNALIQESRAMALVNGKPGGGLTMQFLAEGVEVKPDDTVLTSGLGGSYPRGLLLGRVAKVDGGTLDVFKRVDVEPAVRLNQMESVAVLTSFQPLKLGGR